MTITPTQGDREAAAANILARLKMQHGGEQPWMDASTASMRMGEQDDHWEVQAFALHAQAARLEGAREVERLREALEPFATALDDWGDDTGQPDRWTAWEHPIAMNVTLGDFRRARASLDPLSIAEKGV